MSEIFESQFVSDLHLEFYNIFKPDSWPYIKPIAPNLILAGDVGNIDLEIFKLFMKKTAKDFKNIIYIAGNHEFYQKSKNKCTIDETIQKTKDFFNNSDELKNVHFLHKNSIIIDNVKILGTTLWSNIPLSYTNDIQYKMNDYELIYEKKIIINDKEKFIKLSVDKSNEYHNDHLNWLLNEINYGENNNLPTVVVTHHSPSPFHIIDKYKKYAVLNHAFYTDLTQYIKSPIVAWISGHSHSCLSLTIGDDKVLCLVNCKGYPQENIEGYDDSRILVVKNHSEVFEK